MEKKIKVIGQLFTTTFSMLLLIDQTLQQAHHLYIPEQDKKILKLYYKIYDMKRYLKTYWEFEMAISDFALKVNLIPVVAAEKFCREINKEIKKFK